MSYSLSPMPATVALLITLASVVAVAGPCHGQEGVEITIPDTIAKFHLYDGEQPLYGDPLEALVRWEDTCKALEPGWKGRIVSSQTLQCSLYSTECTQTEVDAAVDAVRDISCIKILSLPRKDFTSDSTLEKLGNLKEVRHLYMLGRDKVTDAGMRHLRAMAKLQYVDISFTCITDVGLAELRDMKDLRQLEMDSCCGISATGLAALKGCTKLRRLNLSDCSRITDAALVEIAQFRELQHLNVGWCGSKEMQITDQGVKALADLKELRMLYLSACNEITDHCLKYIAKLDRLDYLAINECPKLTDAGIMELRHMKRLECLDTRNCEQITEAGVQALKKAWKEHRDADQG